MSKNRVYTIAGHVYLVVDNDNNEIIGHPVKAYSLKRADKKPDKGILVSILEYWLLIKWDKLNLAEGNWYLIADTPSHFQITWLDENADWVAMMSNEIVDRLASEASKYTR